MNRLIDRMEQTSISFKPHSLKLLASFPPSWEEIAELYRSENNYIQLSASLLNSVLSSNTPAFMMSFKIFNSLLEKDENIPRDSCHSSEYKKIIKDLTTSNIIECIYPPSTFTSKKKIAGLYRIKEMSLRKLFDNIEENEKLITEAYVSFQKIGANKRK